MAAEIQSADELVLSELIFNSNLKVVPMMKEAANARLSSGRPALPKMLKILVRTPRIGTWQLKCMMLYRSGVKNRLWHWSRVLSGKNAWTREYD